MLSDNENQNKHAGMVSEIREGEAFRITQDEIILENEQTSNTLQSVVCPVCLLVLGLPHWICEGCDNAFCRPCLDGWWQKNPGTCIFRCSHPSFKAVKRSNTYQAIMDILKTKCKYCEKLVSLSSISSHDNLCPHKPLKCPIQGCPQSIIRQDLEQHTKDCAYRRERCKFCTEEFLVSAIVGHESNQCPERIIKCPNVGCLQGLKVDAFQEHRASCSFHIVHCKWCQAELTRGQAKQHAQSCQKRQVMCQWCGKEYHHTQIQKHLSECSEKTQQCQLCQKRIKDAQLSSHRLECMFQELVTLKASHYRLSEENIRLKVRVHELEISLEESIRNRHEQTVDSLIKIKEQQRKEHERDLLRIRNSIQSLKKCRNQELAQHQKKLHLSTSLCVICTTIRKKLEDELEPLVNMQQETLHKLKDLQRIEDATRKSVIRF